MTNHIPGFSRIGERERDETLTFMESTAQVWIAVTLVLADASSLSFSCVLGTLTPDAQVPRAALLILTTGLYTTKVKVLIN